MRSIIENCYVGFAKESRDRSQRPTKSTVEEHCIFTSKKARELPLQVTVEVCHARQNWSAAGPKTIVTQRFVGGGNYFRMVSQSQVIVGTEIND